MEYPKIKTIEKYFFFLILCLNLIPVFTGKFFPTMDGPAHLHNSQLINSLLFDDYASLKQYYEFNTELVPNWTGHFILTFFNLWLPGNVAEKALILCYLIGLALAFRALIKVVAPDSYLLSYLIFPFTYSCFLFNGFFNFCLGLVFMLLIFRYWIKHENDLFKTKRLLSLFSLITLAYFSHIFVFSISIFVVGMYLGFNTILLLIDRTIGSKAVLIELIKKLVYLLLVSVFPLTLFAYYFFSRPGNEYEYFTETQQLLDWLTTTAPLIGYNKGVEGPFSEKIFQILIGTSILAIAVRVYQVVQEKLTYRSLLKKTDFWLLVVIFMLVLYFNLPDANFYGSYVSLRIALLTFIFFIIWLALQRIPKWISLVMICCLLFYHFKLLDYHKSVTKELNVFAGDCNKASHQIEPGSVVLPLNYSSNWLLGSFSNYMGIDKPMVILENYECSNDYFPLRWKQNTLPYKSGNLKGLQDYITKMWSENKEVVHIDYIFLIGDSKACNPVIISKITEDYHLIYKSNTCELYQLNAASKSSN